MKKKRILALIGCMCLMLCLTAGAFAEGLGEGSSVASAVTTALSTVQSDAMGLIAAVLPYALAIMGAIVVVTVGIRAFKRASK